MNISNSRKVYVAVLLIVFAYSTITSYLKILEEPTTFEETELRYYARFPSVTFCLRTKKKDNYTTFQDLADDLEEFKKYFNAATYKIIGKGVTRQSLNLRRSKILAAHFNSTFDYVWKSSAMIMPEYEFAIVPCTTLNIPYLFSPKRGKHQIYVKIKIPKTKLPKPIGVYVLKHEYKQSTHTYDLDTSKSYQNLELNNLMRANEFLIQTETLYLKKYRYDCFEDNSMNFTDCMEDFIGEQLNCRLPWAANTKVAYEECKSQNNLESFRNLSLDMDSEHIKAKIEKKGCFKPNCKKTTWVKNQFSTKEGIAGTTSESLTYYINIPSTMKVLQKREVKIADFGTFVADFGGYLGLFLGASVLSLTDAVIVNLSRVIKWIKVAFNQCSQTK